MSDILNNLIHLLKLEKIDDLIFRGESQDLGFRQVFGGQVVAQALSAAMQVALEDRILHSCHAYFLAPGDSQYPIIYDVETLREAMDDDFNTPNALSVLFEMAREINKLKTEDAEKANGLAARLRELGAILGLLQQEPEKFLQAGSDDDEVAKIEALIKQRNEARAAKDWATADAARNELTAMGIVLEDGANGTTWRKQ